MARPRTEPAVEGPEDEKTVGTEPPTVVEALSRVMGDVQSVSKTSRNESQNYNFRGIDAVVNAVGPALRAHGVVVVPIGVSAETEQYQTNRGTAMKNVMLTVTFRFYGPRGDHLDATACGEAADSGDKATPKAHSVAYRTMLLQALCIPTDEADPDQESHERSARQPGRPPEERRVEAPAYNVPKSWQELTSRMSVLVGDDEAKVWMGQAIEIATGVHDRATLTDEQRAEAFEMLAHALFELDHIEGDLKLHPSPREAVSQAFAKHLEGRVLNGPPWALTGDEAERGYPAKESVLAGDAGTEVTPPETDAQEVMEQEMAAEAAEAAAAAK